jgi:hypothetical protein
MYGKSLILNRIRLAQAATGFSPADFPIGSLESRAAARALLDQVVRMKPKLSQYDKDALTLYGGEVLLNARMSPDGSDLEKTGAFARGRELHDQLQCPAVSSSSLESHSMAFGMFEHAFGRTPKPGDILRYKTVQITQCAAITNLWFERFIAAWGRQIPEKPCPLRVENGRFFLRLNPRLNNGQEWEEDTSHSPERYWCCIESEARGPDAKLPEPKDMPTIAGVVFLDVLEGERRWRAATERELEEAWIEPTGGILGVLAKAAMRKGLPVEMF